MNGTIVKIIIISFIVIAICSIFFFIPKTSGSGMQDEIAQGRQLYMNHCGDCHRLYDPGEFTKEQWSHYLDLMQNYVKMDPNQKEMIFKYLTQGDNQ